MRQPIVLILWVLFIYIASQYGHWILGLLSPLIFVFWLKWERVRYLVTSFILVFVIWFLVGMIKDFQNEHILSTQIGVLFQGLSPTLLLFISSLLGGIGAVLTAWLTVNLRQLYRLKSNQ